MAYSRSTRRTHHTPVSSVLLASLAILTTLISPLQAADASSNRPLDCTKPLVVNGATYNLSPLASLAQPLILSSSQSTPPSITRTSLSISLCAPLPNPGSSTPAEETCSSSTRICQIITSTRGSAEVVTHVIPLSTEDFGYQVSLGDADGIGGEKNLEWDFDGPLYAGRKQKVEVEMVCDPAAAEMGDVSKLEWKGYDGSDGKAKLRWRTKVACPVKRSDGTIPSGSGPSDGTARTSNSGWGFFSWFFFLLVVGFIVYFALGTYQNHQRYGVAEIPHRDFWREAPYLVQDAGRHAWRSISGQGSRGGAYEPV